ncbi:uncharacterized protein METZ01_LOCUS430796, partial [marine metagenome]
PHLPRRRPHHQRGRKHPHLPRRRPHHQRGRKHPHHQARSHDGGGL